MRNKEGLKHKVPRTAAALGIAASTAIGAVREANATPESPEAPSDSNYTLYSPSSPRTLEDYLSTSGPQEDVDEDRVELQSPETFPIANEAFEKTWERTDKPVADGATQRTWMWGPAPFTPALEERYAESPEGVRVVQYTDKSRMEITHPDGDQESPWYVTNGLLVVELVDGKMQVGDSEYEYRSPAEVNVAGDPDDPNGPTYKTFFGLREPVIEKEEGTPILQQVDRAGNVTFDPELSDPDAVMAHYEKGHNIAKPFWDFMNSEGVVEENGELVEDKLFENPYYATGYAITEPYWATVQVGGVEKEVLIQVFERRVLTYTPDNPDGWQVEAGNVGRHYYEWRYNQEDSEEEPVVCEVEDELPFEKKVIGNFEKGTLVVRNMGCDLGLNDGPIEDRNFDELAEIFAGLHGDQKFSLNIYDDPELVPPAEEGANYDPTIDWSSQVEGAEQGVGTVTFDKESGVYNLNMSIPRNIEGEENIAQINLSILQRLLKMAYHKGDISNGVFDDVTLAAIQEVSKPYLQGLETGEYNFHLQLVYDDK